MSLHRFLSPALAALCLVLSWLFVGPAAAQTNPPAAASVEDVRRMLDEDRIGEAESAARSLLAEAERTTGGESEQTSQALDLLVEALWKGGRAGTEEAADLATRAVAVAEKAVGCDDPRVSGSLAGAAELLGNRGQYDEARAFLERALSLVSKAYGEDDIRVGRIHSALGGWLLQTDPAGSEKHYREAVRILEAAGAGETNDAASALNGLGSAAVDSGQFAEAEELFRRSLRIFENVLGPRDLMVAQEHQNLGYLHAEMGDYETARTEMEASLAIKEETPEAFPQSIVRAIGNLAIIEASLGLPGRARFERGIAMADEVLGRDHDISAGMRANYAIALANTDLEESRLLNEQALTVFRKTLGPDHPRTFWVLSNQGEVVLRMGDTASAERYLEEAVAGFEKNPQMYREKLAGALQGLARCRAETGRLTEARALHERALATLDELFGPIHPSVARALVSYADFLRFDGDLPGAESAQGRALKIRESALGGAHPAVGESLLALADLAASSGRLDEAAGLFQRGLAIQKAARDPDDPRNAGTLRNYASFLLRSSKPRAALTAALEAESISRRHLRSTVSSLSERTALSLVGKSATGLDLAISAASTLREPVSAKAALDALIRSRALVLDEMGERHRAIRVTRDPDVPRLLDEYVAARARLANLTVMGEDEKYPAKYRKRLEEARAAKEAAERALAEKSADFRRNRTQAEAGLAEVARALPEGAALVAFVRYARSATAPASQQPGKPALPVDSYAAFVLRRGPTAPVLVPLGPASVVDAQVALVRGSLAQTAAAPGSPGGAGSYAETSYRRTSVALRDLVWKPLEPHLGGVETVFLVPDGPLQLVSFAALPTGKSRYLVDSGPVLHTLSAERDLVSTALSAGVGLMAAGAPDFDGPPSATPERRPGAKKGRPGATVASALFRGALPSCRNFDSLQFAALPSAGPEIEDVAAAWKATTKRVRGASLSDEAGSDALVLSGPAASETAVKTNAPGRRVVHLATHGFFLGDCPSSSGSETRKPPGPSTVFTENPLLLSGLAFAGANQRGTVGPGVDDGILTAEEIAALDLSGVEWAVLSACETGVGELRSGEGLFGLRRAFQVAGARSLILSLWPVEDEASRQWMQALYRNRLARGMTTARSVHEASLGELLKRRASGLSTHPFYWAGFVATGDWR